MLSAALSTQITRIREVIKTVRFLQSVSSVAKRVSNQKPEAFNRAIELFQIEWFAEINVAAGFQRGFFHAINVVRGDGDDWRLVAAFALEPAIVSDGLQTIQNRHVQIDDKQAGPESSGHFKRLFAVFGFKNLVAF